MVREAANSTAAVARAYIAQAGRLVGQSAVQMHGSPDEYFEPINITVPTLVVRIFSMAAVDANAEPIWHHRSVITLQNRCVAPAGHVTPMLTDHRYS